MRQVKKREMRAALLKNLQQKGHTDGLSVEGYDNIKMNFCTLEWEVVDGIRVAE